MYPRGHEFRLNSGVAGGISSSAPVACSDPIAHVAGTLAAEDETSEPGRESRIRTRELPSPCLLTVRRTT